MKHGMSSELRRVSETKGMGARRLSGPVNRPAVWVLVIATGLGASFAAASPGDLLLTFRNPNPGGGDGFGCSVAAMGGNVLVGAYHENSGGLNVGAAYQFSGSTGQLIQTYRDSTPASEALLGRQVAAVGDKVLAGADCWSVDALYSGAAFLFDGATGDRLRTLANPTPASSDHFGYSVAALGSNVLVGAFGDDTGALDAGAVYLLNASTGDVIRTFQKPTPAVNDRFGISVTAVGNNVLVGAYMDSTGAYQAGAAYLFDGATGALLHAFLNPTPAAYDHFGISVAALGNNVLVGAYHDDTGATDSGAAYLFDGATGALLRTFLNPVPAADDWFGYAVAGVGKNVLIGANLDDAGATDAGAAYLFDGSTGKLLLTLTDPTPATGDNFGTAVGALGDNILIGSLYDDVGGPNVGTAYLFRGVPEPATLAMLAAGAWMLPRRRSGRARG
jgi:hypothetical protein